MQDAPDLGQLYRDHLAALDGFLAEALERAGRAGVALDGAVFHAGRIATYPADDRMIAFVPYPHCARWAPLTGPEHLVLARPGARPKVVRVRPRDFWYDTSPPPASYWEEAVDFDEVERFEDAVSLLAPFDRLAWIGPSSAAAASAGIAEDRVEPPALMAPLDWGRAAKTPYEAACVRLAAEKSARGHERARKTLRSWGSEKEIHWAYLEASDQLEIDCPYETIVALDAKSATLHYQHKRGSEAAPGKVLLIDAGAAHQGYACDLTRTWAVDDAEPAFRGLIEAVDRLERELVESVAPGRPYLEIHRAAEAGVVRALVDAGVLRTSPDEALAEGLVRTFMPHGVGHHLGLQVHDVGGHQAGPDGGVLEPPSEIPYLRNTRTLEPGHLVTIEPGLYFIPMLLEPLRQSADAGLVDWSLVDALIPCGGIRIEDNVWCTADGGEDLSRPLLPGPRGS